LGHRHGRVQAERLQSPRDFEQLLGVVAGALAGREHGIVAGQLALDAEAVHGVPNERMEPVQDASEASDQLENNVVPLDVR
jgi:hypothetical protein